MELLHPDAPNRPSNWTINVEARGIVSDELARWQALEWLYSERDQLADLQKSKYINWRETEDLRSRIALNARTIHEIESLDGDYQDDSDSD